MEKNIQILKPDFSGLDFLIGTRTLLASAIRVSISQFIELGGAEKLGFNVGATQKWEVSENGTTAPTCGEVFMVASWLRSGGYAVSFDVSINENYEKLIQDYDFGNIEGSDLAHALRARKDGSIFEKMSVTEFFSFFLSASSSVEGSLLIADRLIQLGQVDMSTIPVDRFSDGLGMSAIGRVFDMEFKLFKFTPKQTEIIEKLGWGRSRSAIQSFVVSFVRTVGVAREAGRLQYCEQDMGLSVSYDFVYPEVTNVTFNVTRTGFFDDDSFFSYDSEVSRMFYLDMKEIINYAFDYLPEEDVFGEE